MNRFRSIEAAIRSLRPAQQKALALELASLVEPFAEISSEGQPPGGLSAVAQAIRTAFNAVDVDRARSVLWSTPEVRDDDEPDGASGFALGATIAWIYAADALTTAPSDGAVNAFKRAVDLLDAADETLGDTDLVDRLLGDVKEALAATPIALSTALSLSVRRATKRLAPIL